MSGRRMSLGAAAALLVGLAGAIIVVACYELPTPDCGFVCGPGNACPDDYTCADDHYCHRIGAPADLVCAGRDAALPLDAAPDSPGDAMLDAADDGDAMIDAMIDAPDAGVDAPDAGVDAPDAGVDASVDAPDVTSPPT